MTMPKTAQEKIKLRRLPLFLLVFLLLQNISPTALAVDRSSAASPPPAAEMAASHRTDDSAAEERRRLLGVLGILPDSARSPSALLTRVEGTVLLGRLLPEEAPQKALPFRDIPVWATADIHKVYSYGAVSGQSADSFGTGLLSADAFTTMCLRLLGYSDIAGDFSPAAALDFAVQKGIITVTHADYLAKNLFSRQDALDLVVRFLGAKCCGEETTLAEKAAQNAGLDSAVLQQLLPLAPSNRELSQRPEIRPIDAVSLNCAYSSDVMLADFHQLCAAYPFLETGSIGKSVLGTDLPYLRFGIGEKKVFLNAAHHAREWMTSPLVMEFADEALAAFVRGGSLYGCDMRALWNSVSLYIVPMVNPDGVDLCIRGLAPNDPLYAQLLAINRGNPDFSGWKANIRGVDLNANYDAYWSEVKINRSRKKVSAPASEGFSGVYPVSEPETQAMVAFTKKMDFDTTLAYHSSGEVIYWNFDGKISGKDSALAKRLSALSGYHLVDQPKGDRSTGGGYKDWFILNYGRPAFTVEIGRGPSPLPISQFSTIKAQNFPLILELLK